MKNLKITRDTQCCISIATSPGNFGSYIFNETFKSLSMDFIYKPFRVTKADLAKSIQGIRALQIRGCGVSMPHKTVVHKYLDIVDPIAKQIGAINTIVNKDGILTGYNTDVIGVKEALKKYFPAKNKTAHIIGAGGAARAAIVALKISGCKLISISNRDDKKAEKLAKEFGVHFVPNKTRKEVKADILINATPVGMAPHDKVMVIDEIELKNYTAVMDVVVSPLNTKLIRTAKKYKKIVVPGYMMALHQAAAQFTLYTGKKAPFLRMMKYVKTIVNAK